MMQYQKADQIRKKYSIFLIFLIISFGIYFNSLNNVFVLDDKALILDNSYIKNIKFFPHIFFTNIYRFSLEGESNYYRPIQMITYALDYAIFKLNPFGYHLTNIILHSISCYLIYILITILFIKVNFALMVAILYCVSPLQTSVVGYISGRADILVSIFMILSIIKFIRYLDSQEVKEFIFSIISFGFALLSRENSLLLPFLIILVTLIKGIKKRPILLAISCFFVIEVFYLVIRFYIMNDIGIFNFEKAPLFFLTAVNIINIFNKYFILMVYPWPLYLMRTTPFIKNLTVFDLFLFFILISSIIVSIFKDKERIIYFGVFWFILTLSPIIKNIYLFPNIGAAMAENWLYLPLLGFFIIISYPLSYLQKGGKFIFVFILCFYIILTLLNNINFKDELTLYKHILKFSPHNNIARLNLADVYCKQGLYEEAKRELQLVLSKEPTAWNAFVRLGNIYSSEGDLDMSLEFYKKTIEVNPKCAVAYNNLGMAYKLQGKKEMSFNAFLKAIEIDPELWESYVGLGDWFLERDLYKDAAEVYKKAIKLNPGNANAYLKIGVSFAQMGRYQEALNAFQKALNLRPNSIEIMKSIGALYGNMAEFDKAIRIWKKVLELNPNDGEAKINIQKAMELKRRAVYQKQFDLN